MTDPTAGKATALFVLAMSGVSQQARHISASQDPSNALPIGLEPYARTKPRRAVLEADQQPAIGRLELHQVSCMLKFLDDPQLGLLP